MNDLVQDWLDAGNKITQGPTVFLVRSPQGSREIAKKPIVEKKKRNGGGGWAKYWEKRRDNFRQLARGQ
jgi:hypothetical protein